MTITQSSAKTLTGPRPAAETPLYQAGEWSIISFAPLFEASDWDAALKELGFEPWTVTDGLCGEGLDLLPLSIRVWRRQALPRFIVEVNTLDAYDPVFAADLPDLMELLARWSPAIQGLAVANLLADVNHLGINGSTQESLLSLLRRALGQH
ncbi:hypothetical protein AB0467_28280 [Streptomyces sp. NPDC052095]|uniref:hypothetical protein n=1 Tax=unclassified Streptomyces TaxID=2593676 RepID=UPI0034507092